MTTIAVGGEKVMITDETIQIDIGPFGAVDRLYEQSKLIIVFLIFGSSLVLYMSIFASSLLRKLSQFVIVFGLVGFALSAILPKVLNNIEAATEIRRTTIDRVEYTAGSRLRLPKLYIIVTDGEVTGTRSVPLSHRQLGGDQQLEHAIQSFEDAGISVISADDTTVDSR